MASKFEFLILKLDSVSHFEKFEDYFHIVPENEEGGRYKLEVKEKHTYPVAGCPPLRK